MEGLVRSNGDRFVLSLCKLSGCVIKPNVTCDMVISALWFVLHSSYALDPIFGL